MIFHPESRRRQGVAVDAAILLVMLWLRIIVIVAEAAEVAAEEEDATNMSLSSVSSLSSSYSCRSNATHMAWRVGTSTFEEEEEPTAATRRRHLQHYSCVFETRARAWQRAHRFSQRHLMSFDGPFVETLGLLDDIDLDVNGSLPDGLANGVGGVAIDYALQAKTQFPWTDQLPRNVFYEYVVNPFHLNEGRTNWRPLLWKNLVEGNTSSILGISPTPASELETTAVSSIIAQVVEKLNADMWRRLAPRNADTIVFVSGQTPLIFDPMSVLAFGHASCTGLSLLLTSALRTVGIAARIVGTPAWYGQRSQGNHNWVEVYDMSTDNENRDGIGVWKFLEPSPNQTIVDTLDRDPCERWFCNPRRFPTDSSSSTQVTAARLQSVQNTFVRMAWEWNNPGVPAEDRTAYYQRVCGNCSS